MPYSKEILPKGFKYPEEYLRLAAHGAFIPDTYWDFPNDEFGHATLSWQLRIHWKKEGWNYLSDCDPIPFARNGDWAAYFDGNDHSGDPRVIVVDLGNKENSFRLNNFDAWLKYALEERTLEVYPSNG